MLIYFDESYDNDHQYLLLGALFNPHPKFLHRKLSEVKKKYSYFSQNGMLREIKYNYVTDNKKLQIAKSAVDIFFETTSWFRCVVVEQRLIDLNRFGKRWEDERLKRARLYKKFAELLMSHNTENIFNAVLLVDSLTRCNGDEFIEIMKQEFCLPYGKHSLNSHIPTLKDVIDIPSHLEQYQVNQIGDILMGCILNNLKPTQNKFKNQIREHLISKLKVKNLLPETWNKYSKRSVEEYYPKFNIWYWKPK
ncbi:MAG: DUF3800 domain-containing protein [bacterium]